MGPADTAVQARQLAQTLEDYLAEHPAAVLLEDGGVLFDMRTARYAVSDAHGRCLLQLWSDERNLIRTVVEIRERQDSLRIVTRRMGAAQPQALEIVPSRDRRTPTTRDAARKTYQRVLERVLARTFIGAKTEGFRSAMDLEHSFGPAYVRGRLVHGMGAEAVIGVSEAESAAVIDGILTLGLLWLDYCRGRSEGRRHFGGLKVIVPVGSWRTTAERMAHLNRAAAAFELFTLDERNEELTPVDFRDVGNFDAHLVHAFSQDAALERCRDGVDRLLALIPAGAGPRVEIHPRSASEVSFLLHGLDFARVRHGASANSFGRQEEITFGAGANETPLTEENEPLCREMFTRLFQSRHPDGTHADALYRLQPERWLESCLRSELATVFPGLRADLLYSQVPALSSSDRGMLDLLSLDRDGRLAVIELKANEDLHLPLQALDYWIRVRALNADRTLSNGRERSAFERLGYFPDAEVSPLPPHLLLAAPALRIHPANEPVLRYFAPEVEWELIALAEQWRQELKVVFRKRRNDRSD